METILEAESITFTGWSEEGEPHEITVLMRLVGGEGLVRLHISSHVLGALFSRLLPLFRPESSVLRKLVPLKN